MDLAKPSREEFHRLAAKGNLIPVYREMVADLETPVSAFMKIDRGDHAFLLESVEGGENLARYSFLGADPGLVFSSKNHEVSLTEGGRTVSMHCARPLDMLKKIMGRYAIVERPFLPPFIGGAVGYFGYDVVRDFERLPDKNPDTLNVPDMYFILADSMLVFDHVKHRIILLANAHIAEDGGDGGVDAAYDRALQRIEAMAAQLRQPMPPRPARGDEPAVDTKGLQSNFTREEYMKVVERCKEYIFAGDIFQVVPSQRFRIPYHCPPFDMYRALRAVNPSPYMFYLKFPPVTLAGSSPEILVRVKNGQVQIRPIAGTRPRGNTPEEDLALERELLADPKERAEHVMLVDLGRNDCGRVCEHGSVRVDEMMVIERYSHVMHIVSDVVGRLTKDRDAFDALAAAFPAGTVTGAPKIRAMEIIDEMEQERRGPYAGAVGYFSFNGNLDTCIILRTMILKDKIAYVQAGGGVVADSDPAMEYEETLRKARAMITAINLAHGGLQ
ncbi:MAG: anthranilate synthase component I [Candidatus Sumerlaeota bacterium]|nr:anthranilate synthase component I [Candidatus Sumerlaeota bacterium]